MASACAEFFLLSCKIDTALLPQMGGKYQASDMFQESSQHLPFPRVVEE